MIVGFSNLCSPRCLQAVDRRLGLLQEEVAIHQTARIAYANALKAELVSNGQATAAKVSWPEPQ